MAERFSELTPQARAIWAKSGEAQGHGLLAHMLDVAAVVEVLLSIEPESTGRWAATVFGLEKGQLAAWIAALAGLHDFGKAIPGFQAKWPEGMTADLEQGLQFPMSARAVDRHDLASAALLGKALHQLQIAEVNWLRHVVQAVSAHHGYHFLDAELAQGHPVNEPPEWAEARTEILRCFWQTISPLGTPESEELSLAAVNWLAGLTSAADWIGSNPEWFPLGERGLDHLHAYYSGAKQRASAALAQIGWRPCLPLLSASAETDVLLCRVVGRTDLTARPLQQVGDRLLKQAKGPSLLLVEAPMGEGKTELAFLAHLRLQATNGHRGLYVALPTQATGNALFKRALTFLEQFTDGPVDVQLVHGGAAMNDDIRELRAVHLRGVDHSRDQSLSASAWFAQRKRPLLSPYGVGTVDQALYAALNVKHHFVRLWGLANRVVVLDEVHAYDTYTSGLIAALLRWLKALNCSVVLMSATLPEARRTELLRAWDIGDSAIPQQAYPRLLLADAQGVRGDHFAARPLAPIHLAATNERLEDIADIAVDLVSSGGCGALIVNTVDRAQKLFALLEQKLDANTPLILFHARFPADERSERERQVLDAFGGQGSRPQRALLIATQVAEQSLDIDFDFMLSDLAPVDLLLQRAGRLHRHERQRPAPHAQARFWVAGMESDVMPELKETAWGYVYDPYILLRTWALLRSEDLLNLPADIDRLVQAVYGDEPLSQDLEAAIRDQIEIESYGEYLARIQKERRESSNIAINPEQEPQVAYRGKPRGSEEGEGVGLENKTRLGPESITLIPVEVTDAGWCLRPGEVPFAPDQPLPDSMARQLYNRQLKVSRVAVVKRFKGNDVPEAFKHPILRNCHPLPMRHGEYSEQGLRMRLDTSLGLVFAPVASHNEDVE